MPRQKICVRCGRDCSNVPRRRNPAGAYCCKECLDNPRRGMNPAPSEPEYNPLPLDGDPPSSPGLRECAACQRPISADAKVCVYCGYNENAPPTRVDSAEGPECPHCGYDLTGLRSPRCPECGKLFMRRRRFAARGADLSPSAARQEYLKPALLVLICLPLSLIINWHYDGQSGALQELLQSAVRIPICTAIIFGCLMLWVGFEAPIHLILLRLAGLFAVLTLVESVTDEIRGYILQYTINATVYIGLLSEMLDLELSDAAIIGLVSYFVGVGFWLWLAFALR